MNDQNGNDREQPIPTQTQDEQSSNFRLRAEQPRVTRLSRKVLAGGSTVVLLVIGGAVLWSLQNKHSRNQAADELYSTDHHNVADGIAALPKDYTSVPRQAIPQLGPSLPGDLGRPILAAQGQLPTAADPEQQRRDQETEAARVSHLFASTNGRQVRLPAVAAQGSDRNSPSNSTTSSDEGYGQNSQDRKLAFVNASVDRRTVSPDRVAKLASPYIVQAGTAIQGALITGIRSDLPGQITAQVTENVFDTPTGRLLGKGNMQIHYALSAPPRWRGNPELAEVALLHLTTGLDGVYRAANEAERGLLPAEPTICVGQPTALDPTRAPSGSAILWLQLPEVPRQVKGDAAGVLPTPEDGKWTEALREAYADRIEQRLATHIENLAEVKMARRAYSPADLEQLNVNLIGGDPYGGFCGLDQSFVWRPFKSSVNHRTYIRGLYHIGASVHPGPGLAGGSGFSAAMSLEK